MLATSKHSGVDEMLLHRYEQVRSQTLALAEPLSPEDCLVQSMPDASPTKWHLAHTTWFFDTFVVRVAAPDSSAIWPTADYLFNSYYNAVGDRIARPSRGILSRPSLQEVLDYRQVVDDRIRKMLSGEVSAEIAKRLTLGLHHEQQHQELLLTDIKHAFGTNPTRPAYGESIRPAHAKLRAGESLPSNTDLSWRDFDESLIEMGHAGLGFSFDNERPRHRQFTHAYRLASRLITNREYLEFINADGYHDPQLWLSAGWDVRMTEGWEAPLYWQKSSCGWEVFTLAGMRPIVPDEPVCHVSYFEADAFAKWKGCRLPTEFEWERFASDEPIEGNLLESGEYHPRPVRTGTQTFGDAWEWTSSSYAPYPGFRSEPGALGEYNGKFMCQQYVLRGGSCVTPTSHIRPTYRNFFSPSVRWQFTGIRLAQLRD